MKIVILSQGAGDGVQIPSLNSRLTMNTGIEAQLRSYGVRFGMNTGAGGGGSSSSTLVSQCQSEFAPLVTAFNNGDGLDGGWDWLSVNIEVGPTTYFSVNGGQGSAVAIPTDYQFFNRANDGAATEIGTIQSQFVNQAAAYGYNTTPGEMTFNDGYETMRRSVGDVADYLRAQCSGVRVNWWGKHALPPSPLGASGWWNHPFTETQTINGVTIPVFGQDSKFKSAFAGLRTITGESMWNVVSGALSKSNQAWTTDMASYPFGSHLARATARAFEMAENTRRFSAKVDAMPCQAYFPVYPAGRPLHTISPLGFTTTGTPTDLTLGWASSGDRFIERDKALAAAYAANRLTWLASWKNYGSKAAMGTEPICDYSIGDNPFSLLTQEPADFQSTFIDAVFDPLTQAEATLFGFNNNLVGLSLMPSYWFFWTAAEFFLRNQAFRADSADAAIQARIDRGRANLVWQHGGSFSGTVDWTVDSAWHRHVAERLDVMLDERIQRLWKSHRSAAVRNAARQSTVETLRAALGSGGGPVIGGG
jgi:hypothetical protein